MDCSAWRGFHRASDRLANAEKEVDPFFTGLENKLDTVDSVVEGVHPAMNLVAGKVGGASVRPAATDNRNLSSRMRRSAFAN